MAGLLFGVFAGEVHMAGGMLVHQLSVLVVIANGMRLLRTPRARRATAAEPAPAGEPRGSGGASGEATLHSGFGHAGV